MENFEIRNTLFSYISRAHHKGTVYIDELSKKEG